MRYLILLTLLMGSSYSATKAVLKAYVEETSSSPMGLPRYLAEWEESEGILFNHPNADIMKKFSDHNKVIITAADSADYLWWQEWLEKNNLTGRNIEIVTIPYDSIYFRDFGPFYIINGVGELEIVNAEYYWFRDFDNAFPRVIGQRDGLKVHDIGLRFEGGNFVTNGYLSAYATTYIYKQNEKKTKEEIADKLKKYFGAFTFHAFVIGNSDKGFEHIDTYAKPLSPDTWIVNRYPKDDKKHDEIEKFVKYLEDNPSGYGTKNKIFRIDMKNKPDSNNLRGYMNSLISNKTLFFPIYGDAYDEEVKAIYQKALPDYKIVGVESPNMWWYDAVHCRSRNIMKKDVFRMYTSTYGFAADKGINFISFTYPKKGRRLNGLVKYHWRVKGTMAWSSMETTRYGRFIYGGVLPAQKAGTVLEFYSEAVDNVGEIVRTPLNAPTQFIELNIK